MEIHSETYANDVYLYMLFLDFSDHGTRFGMESILRHQFRACKNKIAFMAIDACNIELLLCWPDGEILK